MDIDPAPPPTPTEMAVPPTAKNMDKGKDTGSVARAFVIHGMACTGPMVHKIREVERAFGGRGGGVIGVRWLLQWSRQVGKTASSLVVFLRQDVPAGENMYVRMRGRRYSVEEYEWGRKVASSAAW